VQGDRKEIVLGMTVSQSGTRALLKSLTADVKKLFVWREILIDRSLLTDGRDSKQFVPRVRGVGYNLSCTLEANKA